MCSQSKRRKAKLDLNSKRNHTRTIIIYCVFNRRSGFEVDTPAERLDCGQAKCDDGFQMVNGTIMPSLRQCVARPNSSDCGFEYHVSKRFRNSIRQKHKLVPAITGDLDFRSLIR